MKTKTMTATLASAFALLAQQGTQAQTNPVSVTLSEQTGCNFLVYRDCTGKQEGLQLSMPSGSGNVTLGLWKAEETQNRNDFFWHRQFGSYAEAGARIDSTLHLRTTSATLDKDFQPTQNTWMSYGGRVGKAYGSGSIDAQADLKVYPITINIPAYNKNNIRFPGAIIISPAYSVSFEKGSASSKSTPYGDLHESGGIVIPLAKQMQASFAQSAQIGPVTKASACSEIIFTSAPSLSAFGLCRGNVLQTASKFSGSIGFEAGKTYKDMGYDALYRSAGRRAAYFNNRLQPLHDAANYIHEKSGYTIDVPTYTADSILNFLDLNSPYHLSKSVIAGVSMQFDHATLSFSYRKELTKTSANYSTANMSLNYAFGK